MYVASLSCQVARRSEEDPTFFAPLYRSVDTSNVAVMGFSAGGALAVYAAEESQRVWPGRVKAVVSEIKKSLFSFLALFSRFSFRSYHWWFTGHSIIQAHVS